MTDNEIKNWWKELDLTWKRIFKRIIDINHNPRIEELKTILNLEIVDCSNSYILSLEPLQLFENLKILNCSSTKIISLDKIKNLKNLKELDCSDTDIINLDALSNLKILQTLNCINCKRLDTIDGIIGCENLELFSCDTYYCSSDYLTRLTKREWIGDDDTFRTKVRENKNKEEYIQSSKIATTEQLKKIINDPIYLENCSEEIINITYQELTSRGINIENPLFKKHQTNIENSKKDNNYNEIDITVRKKNNNYIIPIVVLIICAIFIILLVKFM